MITVDIVQAREVFRERIRQARTQFFPELDSTFLRALEEDDRLTQQTVLARKKALRDAPAAPEIEAATTLRDLRLSWPEHLLGPTPFRPEPPFPEGKAGATWTDPDGFDWIYTQARTADGRYAADNPETPDKDEAWAWIPVTNVAPS